MNLHISVITLIFTLISPLALALDEITLPERLGSFIHVGSHRGGGLSPKRNTMAQFQEAFQDGANIIETDLRLTKDGIVIVFHDENLAKSTNCRNAVGNYTFNEIRKCRFKTNQELIPSFEELLAWSVGKVVVNAEFKAQASIIPAIKLMQKYKGQEWVYFQTQERRKSYKMARKFDPKVNLIFCAETIEDVEWALNIKDPRLFAIELRPSLHDKELIQNVKAQNKLVSANSFQIVRDHETSGVAGCHKLLKLGFTILITDQTKDCLRQRDEASHSQP